MLVRAVLFFCLLIIVSNPTSISANACEPMRIMSYNILRDHLGPNCPWDTRRQPVKEIILKNQPDLIGFQELTPDQLKDLKEDLPSYSWAPEFEYVTSMFAYNPEVFEFISFEKELLDHHERSGFGEFKHKQSGEVIYVYNHHLRNQTEERRVEEVTHTLQRIVQQDHIPLIILGDINSLPGDLPVQMILGNNLPEGFPTLPKIEDTYVVANGYSPYAPTPIGGMPYCSPDNEEYVPPQTFYRIDYIFVGPNFNVLDSWFDASRVNNIFPSDHFPIISDLELLSAACPTPTPIVASNCSVQSEYQEYTLSQSKSFQATISANPGQTGRVFLTKSSGEQITTGVPNDTEYFDSATNKYYYEFASCVTDSSGNCQITATLPEDQSNLAEGEYRVHCDVPNTSDRCSGNRFCDFYGGSTACESSGWRPCSNSDSVNFAVVADAPMCEGTPESRANVNGDDNGVVNILDYSFLILEFGRMTNPEEEYVASDINCDRRVDIIDFALLLNYFE